MNKNEFFTKLKIVFKAIILELAIIFGGIILDLTSKAIIQANMNEGDSVTLIPKFLNFCYIKNKNAAFGSNFGLGKIFGDKGVLIFFIVLTVFAAGFFAYLLFKKPQKGILYRIAFSLIISGAIGNLVDRVFLGYVRDFIQFEYFGLTIFGSTTFAVFNIADSCVVVGAILLIVYFLFFDKSLFGKKPIEEETDVSGEANELSENSVPAVVDRGEAGENIESDLSDPSEGVSEENERGENTSNG